MVSQTTRNELLSLSTADRIRVAQDLWDSVADQADKIAITNQERALLDERLAAYHANPDQGDDWDTVRERIRQNKTDSPC